MTLYAEIKSDRASKAQGGNKYIEITCRVGSRQDSRIVGKLSMRADDNRYIIDFIDELQARQELSSGIIFNL